MDLNDLSLPRPVGSRAAIEPLDPQALIAQLGSEVATTLSSALERVTQLAATGRIDRHGLRALREEIDRARRAGIMGQQVVRLATGRVQMASERIDLTGLLREALRQRGREIEARGIEVSQVFGPAEVTSDSTLLFSMLQAALDWCFEHAVGRIELKLEVKNWPAHACLSVAFQHQPPDEVDGTLAVPGGEDAQLSTMSWRLLQQSATVLGLLLRRQDLPGRTSLLVEFPQTLAARLPGLETLQEPEESISGALNSQPLAGRHVVVLASRREVRNVVREALRPMGLMVDFVATVPEAQELCADGLPHAFVYEAALAGEKFEKMRAEMQAEVHDIAFVRIAEQGKAFEVLNQGGRQFVSVGRDALIDMLPEALMFELGRNEGA